MDVDDFFWKVAGDFFGRPGVEEGSIFNFPCVRLRGEFVAAPDHREGHLIVKLPKSRVAGLIDSGVGAPFAPAGKVFREWVVVEERDASLWGELIEESLAFVGS